MRILLLTHHFHPDLSAGSFRMTSLVPALAAAEAPAGLGMTEVEVLTTQPNRYASFNVDAPTVESRDNVVIHRFPLPEHRNGAFDQARSFTAYARAVMRHVRTRSYDLVFATSSKMMTATLGAWISRRLGVPLYLDIRDIFVEGIGDVFPGWKATLATPIFRQIEHYTFSRADRVNLVSEGFRDYFAARWPAIPYSFHTNGIDPEFVATAGPKSRGNSARSRLKVVYAGNFGEGQGLHTIVPSLAKRLENRVEFTLVGDGGRRQLLEARVAEAGCRNVVIRAPVDRRDLIALYHDADVLFLHLNDFDCFERVLPSKIFEYGAMARPIWAGVRGHAARFLRDNVDNAAIFHPCNVEAAVEALGTLRLEPTPRPDFVARFARDEICRRMAADVLATAQSPRTSRSHNVTCTSAHRSALYAAAPSVARRPISGRSP